MSPQTFLCLAALGLFLFAAFVLPRLLVRKKSTPQLYLHLDADRGVITDKYGNVTEWRDQSGNGNHLYSKKRAS